MKRPGKPIVRRGEAPRGLLRNLLGPVIALLLVVLGAAPVEATTARGDTDDGTSELAPALAQSERLVSSVRDDAQRILSMGASNRASAIEREQMLGWLELPGAGSDTAIERLAATDLARHVLRRNLGQGQVDIDEITFVAKDGVITYAPKEARFEITRSDGAVSVDPESISTELATTEPELSTLSNFNDPTRENSQWLGGSCGNHFKTKAGWGDIGLCYWKYRAYDDYSTEDHWIYLQAVTAEPAILSWAADPYVDNVYGASRMTESTKTTLDYSHMNDHDPSSDKPGGGCAGINVGVAGNYGAGNASGTISGVIWCDEWDQGVNGGTSWKRNQYVRGIWRAYGQDREVAHGSLVETDQRPWDPYYTYYTDWWRAKFCQGTLTCFTLQ